MFIEESLKDKLAKFEGIFPTTLDGFLGVELVHLARDQVLIKLEIKNQHKQPFGIMHGGLSLVLAETVSSLGAWFNVEDQTVVGLEINANHIKAVKEGFVFASGKPLHIGRSTQIWAVDIYNTDDFHNTDKQLVCTSRCTLAILSER
ncbi:MAG: PaaI family thioesterase [Bdellovibrionota bacterium]